MADATAADQQNEATPTVLPTASDASAALAESDDDVAYAEGDLPEFSDDESLPGLASTSTSAPRLPLSKPKGGLRKKLPLAQLKKKVGAIVTPSARKEKAKAVEQDGDDRVGQAGGLKMTEEMLDRVMAQLVVEQGPQAANFDRSQVRQLVSEAGISKKVLEGKEGINGKGTKDLGSHKFWGTQPVPKIGTPQDELREGPLEADKPMEAIRQEPYDLHSDFRWSTMNLMDPNELREVYELLTQNYVEDEDATFRFDYSADFIEWALKPPSYVPDWHVGIRVASTGKLVAFISGIPLDLRVRSVTKRCTEINFLCVHKKLRSKRLTPLLIKEVTRRTHLKGIFQAIYTAGVYLPTPVSRCQYYHRSLSPKKLVETGFSAIPRHLTMARMIRQYKLPEETTIVGLREVEKRDLKQVGRLLRAYLARMDMAPLLSNKDIEHALFSGRGKDVGGKRVGQVTWSYVIEDPETHRITDMFSFYSLPSTAVKVKPLTHINAAYLFYYATTACPSCSDLGDGSVATPITNWKDETEAERLVLKERLLLVIGEALVLAAKHGFDVLNALTLQDNSLFLEELKFGRGDGFLHYYLYNYVTKPILGGIDVGNGGSGVGVVML